MGRDGMREIKFRAWDQKNRIFWSGLTGDVLYPKNEADKNHLILMQFTGLHDKNGKEIWEGDVVRFYFCADHFGECQDKTEMIDEVEFAEGAFFFKNHDVMGAAYARIFADICEVLGNIYEHKPLLEREVK